MDWLTAQFLVNSESIFRLLLLCISIIGTFILIRSDFYFFIFFVFVLLYSFCFVLFCFVYFCFDDFPLRYDQNDFILFRFRLFSQKRKFFSFFIAYFFFSFILYWIVDTYTNNSENSLFS